MSHKKPRKDAGKTSPAKKRSCKPTDEQIAQFDRQFEADFNLMRTLAQAGHLTIEEMMYLTQNSGLKSFTPALLRILGQANRRRDAKLDKLLNEVFIITKIAEDNHPAVLRIKERLGRKIEEYTGAMNFNGVLHWVVDETAGMALAVQAMRLDSVRSLTEFGQLYAKGRDALLGGIRSGLASCADLHPDIGNETRIGDDVSELEQRAWLRIWANLSEWTAPGIAAITTRLFAFGQWQARGWKTERLREREKVRRIEEAMQRYRLRSDDEDENAESVAA